MAKKKAVIKKPKSLSKIDFHCYSSLGSGKDSLLRLYHVAKSKNLSALVVTDRFPLNPNAFYDSHEILYDLDLMKEDGWNQKIPIVIGIEYSWPEWLLEGQTAKTLVFGTKAIDQLIGLERYRSIDGFDSDGNLYEIERVKAKAAYFTYNGDPDWRTIFVNREPYIVQQYNTRKDRWIETNVSPTSISRDLYEEEELIDDFKYRRPTGETVTDVWDYFTLALTRNLVEDEDGNLHPKEEIKSAIILCSPNPASLAVSETEKKVIAKLPERFLSLIDAVEVSYSGLPRMINGTNASLNALRLAHTLSSPPLINSGASQAEALGAADEICNQFEAVITSEEELIDALLNGSITKTHMEKVVSFCKEAKEISISNEGLAQNIQAESELGILWNMGEGDEF